MIESRYDQTGRFACFGQEIVHHAEEAGGEEEADGVVAVPPLRHRVLDAGEQRVALRPEERDRHRQVVDDVQHRDGDDEGEIIPVRDIDVRLLAPQDRAQEDDQVDDPDDGEPEVDIPFRLGIFAALGDAQHIARGGEHDEELVAPEEEAGELGPAEERHPAGALDDVERGAEQRVAAEGEDHGRGVDRPQPAEGGPFEAEVEGGVGELEGDEDADREADQPPAMAAIVNSRTTSSS